MFACERHADVRLRQIGPHMVESVNKNARFSGVRAITRYTREHIYVIFWNKDTPSPVNNRPVISRMRTFLFRGGPRRN